MRFKWLDECVCGHALCGTICWKNWDIGPFSVSIHPRRRWCLECQTENLGCAGEWRKTLW